MRGRPKSLPQPLKPKPEKRRLRRQRSSSRHRVRKPVIQSGRIQRLGKFRRLGRGLALQTMRGFSMLRYPTKSICRSIGASRGIVSVANLYSVRSCLFRIPCTKAVRGWHRARAVASGASGVSCVPSTAVAALIRSIPVKLRGLPSLLNSSFDRRRLTLAGGSSSNTSVVSRIDWRQGRICSMIGVRSHLPRSLWRVPPSTRPTCLL